MDTTKASLMLEPGKKNLVKSKLNKQVLSDENSDLFKYVLKESDTGELNYEEDLKLMVYLKLKMNNESSETSSQKKYLSKCSKAYKRYFCML